MGICQRHALAGADDRGVIGLAGKDFEHERPEEFGRQRVVVGVEARLVPAFAELVAVVEIGMAGKTVAGMAIAAKMMGVIEALEVAVLLHHPGALLAHEEKKKVHGSFDQLKDEMSKQKELREQIFAQEMSSMKDRERLLEEKFREAMKRADTDSDKPFRNPLDMD